MSFGIGIGDVIAVLDLANRIRRGFVNAPGDFMSISNEVRGLAIVLQDTINLAEQQITSQQLDELRTIISNCRSVLDDVQFILHTCSQLDSVPHRRMGQRARRIWTRLTWDSAEIDVLRSRIDVSVGQLDAFNGLITRRNVHQLIRHQDEQDRITILEWLAPVEYTSQQSDHIREWKVGTCLWLEKTSEFKEWVQSSKEALLCLGMTGAGKTVLTSVVINKLTRQFEKESNIGLGYIYFDFQRQDEQKLEDLLANILKQFLQGQSYVPDNVKAMYHHHRNRGTRPLLNEILECLYSVVSSLYRAFIIIDALDECQINNGLRAKFVSEILTLREKFGANIFVTSGVVPDITRSFENSKLIEIVARDDDVKEYLKSRIPELPCFVSRNPEMQKQIVAEITKNADGMFLLAKLHLDSLVGMRSETAMVQALQELPTGPEAYQEAYRKTMARIEVQARDQRALAKEVLSWIVFAKRPLSPLEIQVALGVERGKSALNIASVPDIKDIMSACAGLVAVDEDSNIMRLIHHTAQQYFEQNRHTCCPDAQYNITTVCITYLSFDDFRTGCCETENDFDERLRLYPLYDYAARYWGHHARQASPQTKEQALEFLQHESLLHAASQAMLVSRKRPWNSDFNNKLPSTMTGLHLTAYFGLMEQLMDLLERKYIPDVKDANGWTPLSWAARNGHDTVVKLLLEKYGANPDGLDSNDRTPLALSAMHGHEAVVRLLLDIEGIKPDSKDKEGWTPLSWAARNGHAEVVGLLLNKNGVNPDSPDSYSRTPLALSAMHGHEAVVRLLLAKGGAKPDSKDKEGWTPLLWAARNGHAEVVNELIRKGNANPNVQDTLNGRTPLSRAAWYGHDKVVKLLLKEPDVKWDHQDKQGWTPLTLAVAGGHNAVVEALINRRYADHNDINSKDGNGQTALLTAIRRRNKAMVKQLLMIHGIQLDPPDNFGHTESPAAFDKRDSDIIQVLRENYHERGIILPDEFVLHPATDLTNLITCSVCGSKIPNSDIHYHCEICSNGNFDICQACMSKWTFCDQQSHRLLKRVIDNGIPVEIPD